MGLYELAYGRTGSKALRLLQPVSYPRSGQSGEPVQPTSQVTYGEPGGDLLRTTGSSLPGEVRRSIGNGIPDVNPARGARLTVGR
ncbi:MAG TPA: hypothetical protein VF189_04735 [Patescibacteria group bacterium]